MLFILLNWMITLLQGAKAIDKDNRLLQDKVLDITGPLCMLFEHLTAMSDSSSKDVTLSQDQVLARQRGDSQNPSVRQRTRICTFPVHGSQERWWSKACHKFESREQFCRVFSFQSGRDTRAARPFKKRRLHGQIGPQGRVFHSSSVGRPSKVSGFLSKGTMWEVTCLPFGLASAPRVFTKLMKPVVGMLCKVGVRLIVYLDEILIMVESKQLANQHTQLALSTLENLGFVVNYEKSAMLPSPQMES